MGKRVRIVWRDAKNVSDEQIGKLLRNADENDLRIMLAAMMVADREEGIVSVSELSELLGMEKSEIDASMKFWRGADMLETVSVSSKNERSEKKAKELSDKAANDRNEPSDAEKSAKQKGTEKRSAHRNGVLERSGAVGNYSSSELADLMEKRKISAQFIDEAQRIMGKVFRTYDTSILVGIVDQLGFEEEAVLAVLAYTVRRGKKTLRYAEQVSMALYDDGITETAQIMERISRIERSGEVIAEIRALFGAAGREMTATEKRLFTVWTEKFAYDIDVIRLAYDITVDSIQKPVPKYTNSILEKWYSEGLRTAEDVNRYIEEKNSEKRSEKTADRSDAASVTKSYDVEDFFEAALQRSYEDLK